MSNTRKIAYKRAQELKAQKIGNTKITTPKLQPRTRTDEKFMELQERCYELIEDKMLDLSKWNGEGSLFKYAGLID